MSDPNRDALIAKLRALQAKTVANGCTEAEAMAAAAKVDAMLAQYGLARTELDVRESAHERGSVDISTGRRNRHAVSLATTAIGEFTDTKVWYEIGRNQPPTLHIWGEPQDVEVATYLVGLIRSAIDRENADYARLCRKEGRSCDGATFRNVMALRVARRLRDMKTERERAARAAGVATSTGTALVEVKRAVVEQSFKDELGLRLRSAGRSSRSFRSGHARQAGIAAGDRVSLNPGIGNGGASPRLS